MTKFLGESDADMLVFIATQLRAKSSPQTLLSELAVVFDNDTKEFVMQLWRELVLQFLLLPAPAAH
jgi:hypothetical protein